MKFKDVTSEHMDKLYQDELRLRKKFIENGETSYSEMFDLIRQLRWLVTLALFEKEKDT